MRALFEQERESLRSALCKEVFFLPGHLPCSRFFKADLALESPGYRFELDELGRVKANAVVAVRNPGRAVEEHFRGHYVGRCRVVLALGL